MGRNDIANYKDQFTIVTGKVQVSRCRCVGGGWGLLPSKLKRILHQHSKPLSNFKNVWLFSNFCVF